MNDLPAAAQRVADSALAFGLPVAIRVMPEATRTASDAAKVCGCQVGAIVKSLIFRGKDSGRPYLFLVSGANRYEESVVKSLGEAIVRPDAAFVREATGFAIGGIPPFGHGTPLVPYIDADLLQYETVWAAAGTPSAVFPVDPRRLRDATDGVVIGMK